jgi:hypothetical protein
MTPADFAAWLIMIAVASFLSGVLHYTGLV